MKIGLVSDTHIQSAGKALPKALLKGLDGVEAILHAGDLTALSVLDELAALAPVFAVYGNMDPAETRAQLPPERVEEFAGRKIGLTHGWGATYDLTERVRGRFDRVDVIVFGHSHQPLCEKRDGVLLFNPGSPTDQSSEPGPSFGILTIEDDRPIGQDINNGPNRPLGQDINNGPNLSGTIIRLN